MDEMTRPALALNLRRLRHQRALSTVELARRANISRATLTQLEAGGGNPTLDTLYGLANALSSPLADLIAEPPTPDPPRVLHAGQGTRVAGDAVEAWLLDTVASGSSSTEIYDFHLHGGAMQRSAGHPSGTSEHLHVYSGHIRVGPVHNPVELTAGDFVTFDASTEHLYHRIGSADLRGLLVITHTHR